MANRFDKPYNYNPKIDVNKISDLFSKADNMDTFEIKNYSLINKIPLSVQNNDGNNLIHLTIINTSLKSEIHRLEFIKFLFNENVNPDAPNKDNVTPLLLACSYQFEKIVKYLIDIGADINYVDNFNNNAYHYLFAGMIKNYKPIKQKSIIPIQKEIDFGKINLIKDIKKQIFNNVLKNGNSLVPEINAIIETVKNTVASNINAKKLFIDFQKEYNKVINNVSSNKITEKENLISAMLAKFINLIERQWNFFPKTDKIELHTETIDSEPKGDKSGLSILKDSDYKVYIRKECDNIIKYINDDLFNQNKNVDLVDLNRVHTDVIQKFISDNYDTINIGGSNDLLLAKLEPTFPNYNELISEYNRNNEYIYYNCIDNADNIIDYENNTFAGGSRQVEIIDELDVVKINQIFENTKYTTGKLAYTLFNNFNNTFTGDFNKIGDRFQDTIVEYINAIATNNNINRLEIKLLNLIYQNNNFKHLKSLVKKRINFNPGHYLWVFCLSITGIYNLIGGISNLKLEVNQGILLLCSGVYNNTGNIINSLFNVFKPLLIESKIDNTDVAMSYRNFVKLLFDKTISDLGNNRLTKILDLTEEFFNERPVILNTDDLTYLGLNNDDGILDCEKLALYIVNYYNSIDQKPLLQNLVDLLVLIRLFEINKERNDGTKLNNFNDRLKGLYLKPISFGNINNIIDDANMNYSRIDKNKLDKYFETLFNRIDLKIIYEHISQYQIPSRINYYLYDGYGYVSPNNRITNEKKLFLLKQIEANHFGINYIGLLDNIKPQNNLNIDNPAGPGIIPIITEVNLFQYTYLRAPPFVGVAINNKTFFNPMGDDYLIRPPTYMSYLNLLQRYKNNIMNLQNIIFAMFKKIFTDVQNSTGIYSKSIGYLYPIINSLEQQENTFNLNINSLLSKMTKEKFPIDSNGNNTSSLFEKYIETFIRNKSFDISDFNNNLNRLNGLFFLNYYLDTTLSNNKIKIPKFIYHQFGEKPIIIFDNDTKNLNYPGNKTDQSETNREIQNTDMLDEKEGSYAFSTNNNYKQIIKNIERKQFFISKNILNKSFITSKNNKLPPSLRSVYSEFLESIILILSKKALEEYNNGNITISDEILDSIAVNFNDIQKKYLLVTYTQEIIIEYLKNNVYNIGYELFYKLINDKTFENTTIENIFGSLDFNVILNKDPNLNDMITFRNLGNQIVSNYYNFSENIDKMIEKSREFFKLYSNNYNSLNLNKSFFRVDIKKNIIDILFDSNCDIFCTNNEGQISIINLLKYLQYDILKNYKDKGIDFNQFSNNNYLSPQKYILNEYKTNIRKFVNSNNYLDQICNFINNQYMDVVYNIFGNEKLGFNIIKNLKTSFILCFYITQQFLSEKMYNFNDNFKSNDINKVLTNLNINGIDFQNLFISSKLSSLNIYNDNNSIVIEDILKKLDKEFEDLHKKLRKLEIEKRELQIIGIQMNIQNKTNITTNKINITTNKISENRLYYGNLQSLNREYLSNINSTQGKVNIIDRYKLLLNNMGDQRLVFMEAFKKMINRQLLKESNENVIQHLLNHENNNIDNNLDYNLLEKFYSNLSGYCEVYFHNEYVENNPILEFVKELLIFLTENVICIGLENLIRNILFEYFSVNDNTNLKLNNDKINLILRNFDKNKYNLLSEKIVLNNTNIFINELEENSHISESIFDLFNDIIDSIIKLSSIKLDDEKLKENLKSIIPYFETIVPKTINNWRVVIENQFLFVINHGRILKCMNVVNN